MQFNSAIKSPLKHLAQCTNTFSTVPFLGDFSCKSTCKRSPDKSKTSFLIACSHVRFFVFIIRNAKVCVYVIHQMFSTALSKEKMTDSGTEYSENNTL